MRCGYGEVNMRITIFCVDFLLYVYLQGGLENLVKKNLLIYLYHVLL